MKKQSKAEWLANYFLNKLTDGGTLYATASDKVRCEFEASKLLSALRRRGWKSPPKRSKTCRK